MNPALVDPRNEAERLAEKIEAAHKASTMLPVCPYCAIEALYSFREMEVGPWVAMQIFCGNPDCKRLFNVQITGPSKATMKQAMERSRILV